jgi:hypothetical protein
VHHLHTDRSRARRLVLPLLLIVSLLTAPDLAMAQASPFMTGATSLQTNLLAWLTPVAIILVMVLGGMAMANRIVENCGNTLILRCSASEGGGTARFASQLIGDREVLHTTVSKSRQETEVLGSITHSEHRSVEPAVLPSQVEQLPDLAGYRKYASDPQWQRVRLDAKHAWQQRQKDDAHRQDTDQNDRRQSHERAGRDHE